MTRFATGLTRKRATLNEDDKGFTLIELLVVVIIIGILAAIAIPVYIGVQNSAKDGSASSDLTNAKIAVLAYATANNGALPTTLNSASLANFGWTGTVTDATSGTKSSTNFCLTATGSKAFWITASGGAVSVKPTGCV